MIAHPKRRTFSIAFMSMFLFLSISGAFAGGSTEKKASAGKLTPGMYKATAQGFMGSVTVLVAVDAKSILSVDVVSCTDLPRILTKFPLKQIPQRIVGAQSTNVDVVTGATFTSSAIIRATRDALKQAGNAEMFAKAAVKTSPVKGADESVDVLVVGGGGAGISAALSAKYADLNAFPSGLKVMLVEKQGFVGGSMVLSGGSTIAAVPIDKPGMADDPKLLQGAYDYLQKLNTLEINKPLIHNMLKVSGDTVTRLHDLGMPWVITSLKKDPSQYSQLWQRFTPYMNKTETFVETSGEWYYKGERYATFFDERLDDSGVDVRVNTKADELIVKDGEVVGAKVTGPDATYNVYAKKVILASGGFVQNARMVQKYAPKDAGVIPFANGGSDGDGLVMAEAVDAAVVGDRMMGYLGTDFRFAMWSDLSVTFHRNGNNGIFVNTEGKRFIKDSKDFNLYVVYGSIFSQPGKKAFAIIDSANPVAKATEASTQTAFKWKSDTIEGLAQAIGVPADNLKKTVDSFNAAYHAGKDDEEFGVVNKNMVAIEKGPYYAIALNPIAIGSLVGLKVSENCEVINKSGKVVPNLYAIGEMSLGGNFFTTYAGAWGNSYALFSGRIAGEHAKKMIKE